MSDSQSIFKNAYEEGLVNENTNFDSWLQQFGLSSIILDKFVNSNENVDFFFNRQKEIEKIAQFIGVHDKQKKFGYVNIVGPKGIGKTAMLRLIEKSYRDIKPEHAVLYKNAEEFSVTSEGDEGELISDLEIFLNNLNTNNLVLIDNCEEDINEMTYNIKKFSSFDNPFFVFSWRPLHWRRFKLAVKTQLNIEETEIIDLKPFEKEELIEFIEKRIKSFKTENKSILPMTMESLDKIAELSRGIPRIALILVNKAIKRGFQINKKEISKREIEDIFKEEGFLQLTEFLENCTPVTRKILKEIVVNSSKKGISIDELAEIVELDRTSVFYHIQKMRVISILDEKYIGKAVIFSLKESYLPLVDFILWERGDVL